MVVYVCVIFDMQHLLIITELQSHTKCGQKVDKGRKGQMCVNVLYGGPLEACIVMDSRYHKHS